MASLTADFQTFGNVINGELRSAGQTIRGIDPRTETALWEAPVASRSDLDDAVATAKAAFHIWSKTSISERHAALQALAKELAENKEILSYIVAKETGKSKFMGDLEVEHSIDFLKFNATQSLHDEVEFEDDTIRVTTTHVPLGVVGAICPWNFPLVLAMAKIAAALVTGNTIIVKPSPYTPYSTLKFAEFASKVLPHGVFQSLNGDSDLGEYMTLHPGIQKISFTGSTRTGKRVMETCAKTLKRITLELGGNDASIVLPDVDINKVAPQVATGCFFNSGQMCVATKRVYVHESIYESFKEKFVESVQGIPLAKDSDVPTILGPLQNKMQNTLVQKIIQDSKINGYKFILGGDICSGNGYFIQPCVIDNPPDSSIVVQEEQFGPIVPLLSWCSESELLSRVNNTQSGLGSCVWSKDLKNAERIGRKLETGSVWLNSFEKPHPAGFLGGHKESGIGGEWGKQGLLSYTNIQTIHAYKS